MESTLTEQHLELKRQFQTFLEEDHGHGQYASKISEMMASEEPHYRLMVDVADVRSYDDALHTRLMNEPAECLPPFEDALEETVQARDPKWLPEGQRMRIGLAGEFGAHTVSPRNLLAPLITKMVNVQGIVTKCSLVRPKMVKSVHYCEATGTSMTREYRDVTSHNGPPTGSTYPTKDDNGNLLSTEFGLCQYRDNQVHPTAFLLTSAKVLGEMYFAGWLISLCPRAFLRLSGVFCALSEPPSLCTLGHVVPARSLFLLFAILLSQRTECWGELPS